MARMRKARTNSAGMLKPENRDYVAEARAAAAAIAAEGRVVTTVGIANHCHMSPHNACQAVRFLRSEGELPRC